MLKADEFQIVLNWLGALEQHEGTEDDTLVPLKEALKLYRRLLIRSTRKTQLKRLRQLVIQLQETSSEPLDDLLAMIQARLDHRDNLNNPATERSNYRAIPLTAG